MAFSRIPNRWLGICETLRHAPDACQHSFWQPLGRPKCAGSELYGAVKTHQGRLAKKRGITVQGHQAAETALAFGPSSCPFIASAYRISQSVGPEWSLKKGSLA